MTLREELRGDEYQGKSHEEAAAIVNAKSSQVRRDAYVSYRTILGVVKSPAILEAIATFVKAQFPTTHEILLQVGSTDGQSGGVNNADAATRAFYSLLRQQVQGVTDAHVAALEAVGVEDRPYRQELGFYREIDFADVIAAREE